MKPHEWKGNFQLNIRTFSDSESADMPPQKRFRDWLITRSANGIAKTCGCKSARRKEKNGNSSITSIASPVSLKSWITRDAPHHCTPPVRVGSQESNPPGGVSNSRSLSQLQKTDDWLPSEFVIQNKPRACNISTKPCQLLTINTRKGAKRAVP